MDEADNVEALLQEKRTGTREVRLRQDATPDLTSPLDG